jgi:adenylylsulfate reductase subunit A
MKDEWYAFANCKYNPKTGEWTMIKRPVLKIVPD